MNKFGRGALGVAIVIIFVASCAVAAERRAGPHGLSAISTRGPVPTVPPPPSAEPAPVTTTVPPTNPEPPPATSNAAAPAVTSAKPLSPATKRPSRPAPPAPAPAPVVTPVSVSGPAGAATSFSFLQPGSPGPGRFNPCQPIRYLVNDETGRAGTVDLIQQSFARLGEASGVSFTFAGTTSARVTPDWTTTEHPAAPGAWPPVLVFVGHRSDTTFLKSKGPDALGNGGPFSTQYEGPSADGQLHSVSGMIEIDGDRAARYAMSFETNSLGSIILHEIGHVLGLGHTSDPTQLMYARSTVTALGAGDLAGLALVGAAAGCLDPPPPPWATSPPAAAAPPLIQLPGPTTTTTTAPPTTVTTTPPTKPVVCFPFWVCAVRGTRS